MAEPRRVGTPATPRGLQINQGQGGPSPASILGAISGAIASRGGQGGGGTGSMPAPQGGGVGAGIADAGQSIGDALQRAQERKFILKRDAEQKAFIKEQTDEQQRYAERNMKFQVRVEQVLAYRELLLKKAEILTNLYLSGDADPADGDRILAAVEGLQKAALGMDPFAVAQEAVAQEAVEGTAAPLFGPEMNEAAKRQSLEGGGVLGAEPQMMTPGKLYNLASVEAQVNVLNDVLKGVVGKRMTNEQFELLVADLGHKLTRQERALGEAQEALTGDYLAVIDRYMQEAVASQVGQVQKASWMGSTFGPNAVISEKPPDMKEAWGRAVNQVPRIKKLYEEAETYEARRAAGEVPTGAPNFSARLLHRLFLSSGKTRMETLETSLSGMRGTPYKKWDKDQKALGRSLVELLLPPEGWSKLTETEIQDLAPAMVEMSVSGRPGKRLAVTDMAPQYLKGMYYKFLSTDIDDRDESKAMVGRLLEVPKFATRVREVMETTNMDYVSAVESLFLDQDPVLKGTPFEYLSGYYGTPNFMEVYSEEWDAAETIVKQPDQKAKAAAAQSYLDTVRGKMKDQSTWRDLIEPGGARTTLNPFEEDIVPGIQGGFRALGEVTAGGPAPEIFQGSLQAPVPPGGSSGYPPLPYEKVQEQLLQGKDQPVASPGFGG